MAIVLHDKNVIVYFFLFLIVARGVHTVFDVDVHPEFIKKVNEYDNPSDCFVQRDKITFQHLVISMHAIILANLRDTLVIVSHY